MRGAPGALRRPGEAEAWEHAQSIIEPWVRVPEGIGSDELTQVMEKALAAVEEALNRARTNWSGPRLRRKAQRRAGRGLLFEGLRLFRLL